MDRECKSENYKQEPATNIKNQGASVIRPRARSNEPRTENQKRRARTSNLGSPWPISKTKESGPMETTYKQKNIHFKDTQIRVSCLDSGFQTRT